MTHSQLPIEEIELIPHPMDAWRAALNALIACAPGDETAIAWHLVDASSQLPASRGAVQALLHEATRANGKCLLTKREAVSRISAETSAQIIRGLGLPELRPASALGIAQPACSRSQKPDHGGEAHQSLASLPQQPRFHQSALPDGERS
ncbi:hypothetical protein [Zestomonas carbonaria]|uniref:Uncharacterized protein n=1 Tax=Zestomonas carbonaria TaxID=2762745 RepID=A0A7U7I8D5_9GAMM|nr:hypothetical protein [Pseudomonas carbonaria]CAD5107214.1 hypothetical protein PSEWESI4_01485 [Pseudomonas carbonaria]